MLTNTRCTNRSLKIDRSLKICDRRSDRDDALKAELLNSYFVSVCTTDNGTLPPITNAEKDLEDKPLENISFKTEQVLRIVKTLTNKKYSGPDGFPPILFRQLASKLARPLAMIFNLIMQAGEVPDI